MICMQGGADRGSGGRRRYMAGSHVLKPCSRMKEREILSSTGTSCRRVWRSHATELRFHLIPHTPCHLLDFKCLLEIMKREEAEDAVKQRSLQAFAPFR